MSRSHASPSPEDPDTEMAEGDGEWIGSPIPNFRIAIALFTGAVGVAIAGVQPILYGALLEARLISMAQVGHAAMIELLMLGVGVGLTNVLTDRMPPRAIAVLGAGLLALANIASLFASGEWISAARGISGLAGGSLVWISVATIVRSPRPTFLSAASLLTQAVLQCSVAAILAILVPGAAGGVPIAIAILSLVVIVLSPFLPAQFATLHGQAIGSALPPARGWLALAAILLLQASIVGAWVYIEPLGKQAGLTIGQVAFVMPASLGAQIVGGLTAIVLTGRVPWFAALFSATTALAGIQFGLAGLPAPGWTLMLTMAFGALWTFSTPNLTPFAIDNDPSRITATLGPSAMLIGSGLGPLAASMASAEEDVTGVFNLCGILAVVAVTGIVLLLKWRPSRSAVNRLS